MIKTEVIICESEYSDETGKYADNIVRSCQRAMQDDGVPGTLNISFVSEDEIRRLNSSFRNIDSVTDVLSFPANILEEPIAKTGCTCDLAYEDEMIILGDIAICVERAKQQAEEYGHSLERELCFLALHGTLHLMGYDHVTEEGEAEMFGKQKYVLDELGIVR